MTFRFAALLAVSTTVLLTGAAAQAQAPDFGSDTSVWANDGECDDPRFTGAGMAAMTGEADRLADATDCRSAFEAGTVQLIQDPAVEPSNSAAPAPSAKDAQATTTAGTEVPEDQPTTPAPTLGAAQATAPAELPAPPVVTTTPAPGSKGAQSATAAQPTAPIQINFGDDSSQWANDGECDDRRFAGQGMAASLNWAEVGRDASDCRALHDAGSIRLWIPGEAQAATQCAAINFGDNRSQFANDGECDDTRFEGLGVAGLLNPSESGHDAADCSQLCAFGAISLRDY
jgi:hypothetical protein